MEKRDIDDTGEYVKFLENKKLKSDELCSELLEWSTSVVNLISSIVGGSGWFLLPDKQKIVSKELIGKLKEKIDI